MKGSGRYADYRAGSFRNDLLSGFIVGIIAIPLGMAFAIASGVKPEYGIYTTIVAGVLISVFGGSRYQIGGPTGAFVPVLLAVTLQYGYEGLLTAGMMAGVILVALGLLKAGSFIRFMPKPVIIGFTSGIGVIIFAGQLPAFLGLDRIDKQESFLLNIKEMAVHLSSVNAYSIATAAIGFAGILLARRYLPKVPASLVGLLISAAAAVLLFDGRVETIGSLYGEIPNALPALRIPELSLELAGQLFVPALTIAMLGGIESLLSAVVADGMTGSRHNSNRELVGQGIANIVAPLFGGIPATGAIARTAANVKSGAASPVSGIVHALVVLGVLMAFAGYASRIPLASMAPILMVVAWNMSERRAFMGMLRARNGESLVLATTFLLTVFTNLTIAVLIGVAMSFALFISRVRQQRSDASVAEEAES